LTGTNVTSRGFANLSEMMATTHVEADGTHIDDRAIDSMQKMAGLKSLYISNTRVTESWPARPVGLSGARVPEDQPFARDRQDCPGARGLEEAEVHRDE
jgi:hypothetical protein